MCYSKALASKQKKHWKCGTGKGAAGFSDTSLFQLLSRDVIDKKPQQCTKKVFLVNISVSTTAEWINFALEMCWRETIISIVPVSDTYLAELFLHKQCAAFMIEPIWNSEISRDYKNANKIVHWSLFHNVLRALNSPDFEAFSAFWVDSVVLECEEKPLWHVFFFKSDLLANRSVNKTCNWNRELADLSGSFYGRSFT